MATQPLYRGGRTEAQVRQAINLNHAVSAATASGAVTSATTSSASITATMTMPL